MQSPSQLYKRRQHPHGNNWRDTLFCSPAQLLGPGTLSR